MKAVHTDIIKFIQKQHILHLATAANNKPYCATCFYHYDEKSNFFLFGSSEETRHIQEALQQDEVAFSIALDTKIITHIQGVQVLGVLSETTDKKKYNSYVKRFPVALFMPFKLWQITPYFIKMTDNRLGFGKKIIWKNE